MTRSLGYSEHMPASRPNAEQMDDIASLSTLGRSQSEIASALGLTPSAVSWALRKLGLWSDEAKTNREMLRGAQERAAALRAQLELDLAYDAVRLRESLYEPVTVHTFTKGGQYCEGELPEPSPRDKQSIVAAGKLALDGSLRIAESNAGPREATINLLLSTARALGLEDGE